MLLFESLVVLSSKLLAFSQWNQHSLTVNVYDTLIRHRIHNMPTRGVWFTAAVDTCQQTYWMPICDLQALGKPIGVIETFGIWQKFTNHKLEETFKRWKPLWERAERKQLLPWLALDINDMFNSQKANQKPWICLDLCTTSVIYLGQFPAESQRTFISIKHAVFTVLRSRCTNWHNHAALTYFLLLRLYHSLRMESNKRQSQN